MGLGRDAVRLAIIAFGLAVGGQAAAADLRRPAPVPALLQPTDWTGFYLCANAGYGWNHADVGDSFSAPGFGPRGATTVLAENLKGGVWGGQVGYNWQFGHVVAGLEADFSGSGQLFDKSYACDVGGAVVPGCTILPKDRIRWFGTARARAGFTNGPWLLYLTGGAAWQNLASEGHVSMAGVGGWDVFNTSTTRVGYSVGLGAEAALSGK